MGWIAYLKNKVFIYVFRVFFFVSGKYNFIKGKYSLIYLTYEHMWSTNQEEDAYDMRKALSRDRLWKSVVPLTEPVRIDELEF